MLKRVAVAGFLAILACLLGPNISYADNAEVLPKGVSRAGVNGKFYLPIDERYDPDGKTEDVAADFNDTLDSRVLPALALVESGFGMPAGSANIGRTGISFEYDFKIFEFSYQYGITELYKYGFGFKDSISGDMGFAYESLEDETDYAEHVGIVSLAYSTLPLYKAKKFPVPLNVSVSYRNRFAGSNNTMKSQYIGFGLAVYF